ncbi:hypothetical protein RhiirA1_474226 [Rhizophagus irregularis]|uniref:Uncharacterized protein n=1 Tax=Rhizophagus irregularis TaxID=588596 RepID=A0A2I1FKP1_9GLOM|nr:hypothetical protein RhiirA1_474226 [Rhizophagus irregularis]PKY34942.1 hypothetical protein RhiirB3_455150 [Rhizophagus irregularis]
MAGFQNIVNKFFAFDEQFEDALASPTISLVLTVPSKNVVEKFNQLNNDFSERINKISGKEETQTKGKDKATESELEKVNENKKRVDSSRNWKSELMKEKEMVFFEGLTTKPKVEEQDFELCAWLRLSAERNFILKSHALQVRESNG